MFGKIRKSFSSRPMVLVKFWTHIYSYNFKSWMKRSRLRICLRVMVNELLASCVKKKKKFTDKSSKCYFLCNRLIYPNLKINLISSTFKVWELNVVFEFDWTHLGMRKWHFVDFSVEEQFYFTQRQLLNNHRSYYSETTFIYSTFKVVRLSVCSEFD